METVFLGLIGASSGLLIAGGVVAMMVGLGIITRFIGIAHLAKRVKLFESCICLGGLAGCLLTVYYPELPFRWPGLLLLGLFCGIFVGGWIMALAELLDVFPVVIRRLNLTKGNSWIVVTLAFGKMAGSLLGFYFHFAK